MIILIIIIALVYIWYFLSEAYNKWTINRKIEKYEKIHPEEIQDHNKAKISESELSEGQLEYKEYLNSEHWQQIRKVSLERAGYKCQVCGYKGNLQVHHNDYRNRGHEDLTDLVVLCGRCHSKFHNK